MSTVTVSLRCWIVMCGAMLFATVVMVVMSFKYLSIVNMPCAPARLHFEPTKIELVKPPEVRSLIAERIIYPKPVKRPRTFYG